MTAELLVPCCGERVCQRQQPMRLVHDDGRWFVATQYIEGPGGRIKQVMQRHELRSEDAALLSVATAPVQQRVKRTVELPEVSA